MKTIYGLLLKDLYVFKSYKKNIIFSFFVFVFLLSVIALRSDIIILGSILFLIFFGMNSISTFSYDEMSSSEKYLLSLPISRKELVIAKYLFAFLTSFGSLLLGFIISILITFIVRGKLPLLSNAIKIGALAFTSVSFLIGIDTPCIYKWGVEKGRMQSVLMPVLIFSLLGIIAFIIILLFPNVLTKVTLELLSKNILIICLFVNILIYLISYAISYCIFSRKDL